MQKVSKGQIELFGLETITPETRTVGAVSDSNSLKLNIDNLDAAIGANVTSSFYVASANTVNQNVSILDTEINQVRVDLGVNAIGLLNAHIAEDASLVTVHGIDVVDTIV